jgi:hypothetical protein
VKYIAGGFLVVLGLALIVGAGPLGRRIQRSNAAFFGDSSFQSQGWSRWNAFTGRAVGLMAIVIGLLMIFDPAGQ